MNWLRKRLERLEKAHNIRIGKGCFVYRMAKEQDPKFDGKDGSEAVSLMMDKLRAGYNEELSTREGG